MMAVEPHKLQQDPPEGSRETIERELKRQEERRRENGARKPDNRRDQARKAQEGGGGTKAAKGPITKADRRNENSSQQS